MFSHSVLSHVQIVFHFIDVEKNTLKNIHEEINLQTHKVFLNSQLNAYLLDLDEYNNS